jgi:hypothetical protein
MRKYRLQVDLKVVGGSDAVQPFLDALMKDLIERESVLDAALGVDLTHATAKYRPHAVVDLAIVLRSASPFSASIRGFETLIDAIVKSGGTPKGWEDAGSVFDPTTIREIKETRRDDHERMVATFQSFAVRSVAA